MKYLILCVCVVLFFPPLAFSQNLEPIIPVSDTLTDPDAYRRSLYLTSSLAPGHFGLEMGYAIELLRGRPKKGQHVAFSARAGYIIGLGQEQWRALNAWGLNAPGDRTSQAYISANYWLSRNYPRKSAK